MDEKRRRRLISVASAILLPIAMYFLGYFAMLRGRIFEQIGVDPVTNQNLFLMHPDYHADVAEWLFHPAHLLDRRFRRGYWTKTLPE